MKNNVPDDVVQTMAAFINGLQKRLGTKLYGIYLYGAAVFDDGGPVQDIDCHVILNECLVGSERKAIAALLEELVENNPQFGEELDAYFILLEEAKGSQPPRHQLDPSVFDTSWALHCAHVRAGRYAIIYGPEPSDIFPAPTWTAVANALQYELAFVKSHLQYPAYCVLNLCRIVASFMDRDPVKSKHGSGLWAAERYPEWATLIHAAMRFYCKKTTDNDADILNEQLEQFYAFMEGCIEKAREKY